MRTLFALFAFVAVSKIGPSKYGLLFDGSVEVYYWPIGQQLRVVVVANKEVLGSTISLINYICFIIISIHFYHYYYQISSLFICNIYIS